MNAVILSDPERSEGESKACPELAEGDLHFLQENNRSSCGQKQRTFDSPRYLFASCLGSSLHK
jgi:hypothetical protein